ncbi:hypothetical protein [Nocardioides sp. SYSU D00038]|uniref:hypothetical protein n=1 Tax=Nocardioides sp. SYSU D00038 TaxID=2812554 RepID=UPI001967F262|nr:hypothetical protein [Nocardioides sp. SYSU D00038]
MAKITPSFVVASLALVVACTGGAYAATKIGSAQIKNNSIQSKDVRNRTLTGKDVKDGSLTRADVRAGLPATFAGDVVMGNGGFAFPTGLTYHFPSGNTPGTGVSLQEAGMVVPVPVTARDLAVTSMPGTRFAIVVNGEVSALSCVTGTDGRCANRTARVHIPAGAAVAFQQYRDVGGGAGPIVPFAFGWRAVAP